MMMTPMRRKKSVPAKVATAVRFVAGIKTPSSPKTSSTPRMKELPTPAVVRS